MRDRSTPVSLRPPAVRRRSAAAAVSALSLALPLLFAPGAAFAADRSLHQAVGDPARRDREAPVVLDGVTDTRSGEVLTPDDLPARLAGVDLLLLGESHTDVEFHRVQLRVLEELVGAGREVSIGLEMYPFPSQPFLDQWTAGLLTEEGFLALSHWYESWGYNWAYYRDIFLFARDHRLTMVAVNAPRALVTAVREQGLGALAAGDAAHLPPTVDTASAEHRTLFRSFFDAGDSMHGSMSEEQWDAMFSAQCTWDATMGWNAVAAIKAHHPPGSILVVLAGSGHVAYGLGIARQAARWYDGEIATLVPVSVRDEDGATVATVRASYADFLWGVPAAGDPLYPSLGLSTAFSDGPLRVVFVDEKSPAAAAGVATGDLLLALDGAPLSGREALNRAMAAKRWGDTARLTVRRGEETKELTLTLRRRPRAS